MALQRFNFSSRTYAKSMDETIAKMFGYARCFGTEISFAAPAHAIPKLLKKDR